MRRSKWQRTPRRSSADRASALIATPVRAPTASCSAWAVFWSCTPSSTAPSTSAAVLVFLDDPGLPAGFGRLASTNSRR